MKTETPPNPYTIREFGILRSDETAAVIFRHNCLEDLQYRRDYAYGEILAEFDATYTATRFSHWERPSGAHNTPAWAVWHWEPEYKITRSWRVGRNGQLHPR